MRCHGEVSSSTSLSDIADHAGCPSCDLDFDNDLSTNVEVLFAPHPGVLPRVEPLVRRIVAEGTHLRICARHAPEGAETVEG